MSQHPADHSDAPRSPPDPQNSAQPHDAQRGTLPPYRVVLHPNTGADLMYVVRTVMELTRFCRAEATHKMWEAQHCGRSVLLVTYRERAELYVEQFQGRGLIVTIEPG